jgi:hypothetical protein
MLRNKKPADVVITSHIPSTLDMNILPHDGVVRSQLDLVQALFPGATKEQVQLTAGEASWYLCKMAGKTENVDGSLGFSRGELFWKTHIWLR